MAFESLVPKKKRTAGEVYGRYAAEAKGQMPVDDDEQNIDEDFDLSEAAVKEAFASLSTMLGGMQGVDHEKLFRPYIDKIRATPTPEKPGRAESFARGFGSDFGAESVMRQLETARKAEEDKESHALQVEGELLKGKLQQEMAKGQYDRALKTNEANKLLEVKLDQIKSKRALTDWKEKQEFVFGKKAELEGVKAGYAHELIQAKAREMAKARGFDDKLTLKLIDKVTAPLEAQLKAYLTFNPITGNRPSDQERAQMTAITQDYIAKAIEEILEQRKPMVEDEDVYEENGESEEGAETAAPAAATAAPTPDLVRIAQQKQDAKNKGRKKS